MVIVTFLGFCVINMAVIGLFFSLTGPGIRWFFDELVNCYFSDDEFNNWIFWAVTVGLAMFFASVI